MAKETPGSHHARGGVALDQGGGMLAALLDSAGGFLHDHHAVFRQDRARLLQTIPGAAEVIEQNLGDYVDVAFIEQTLPKSLRVRGRDRPAVFVSCSFRFVTRSFRLEKNS